jgi:enoyl-CoA hydratase/carnithine racemase
MAHQAARYAKEAVRLTKELLNADPRPWQETLDAEAAAVLEGFGNEELQQRLRAFAERKHRRGNG